MAQKQYTTYQADILSFELRDAMLGLLNPGRYRGYDTMAANGSQVGNVIPLVIRHTATGIPKYDKQDPPVLEATRGIALTTQGTVIAEDGDVSISLTLRSVLAGGYHKIYMEHAYVDGSPGVNPATYGIISWDADAAEPALPNPTKNVVLGYIIEIPQATSFLHLSYYPTHAGMGDQDLYKKLFRGDEDGLIVNPGNESIEEGIIGDRNFSSTVYISDYDSITRALSTLDSSLSLESIERLALENYVNNTLKLDDLQIPDDNTDLNATSTRHGLLPKLSGDNTQFLAGNGSWQPMTTPLGADPIFINPTGTINENHIYRLGYLANVFRIQFNGTLSYGNLVIPNGMAIISIPSTSFNPAPLEDYYGFIWIYSGTAWIPIRMKYTTGRSIVLLEATPFTVATSVPFRVSFMI